MAFELNSGLGLRSLPAEVVVRHSCDNPPCCNPAHLLSGGHRENTDDKIERDRHTKGEDVNTAVLTETEVMEARRLWREGTPVKELCRRFGLSKSAMWYAVSGRSWKHLPLVALVLLLMVAPAHAQMARFVISDGSTQSEYATPSPDRNVICPVCEEAGKKSTVRRWLGYTNTLSWSPGYAVERSEARYWDEEGKYHDHELAQELLVCSSGHRFYDYDDHRCWCEFPHKRYVVLDEVNHTPGITYTPNGTVIAPMSYQHPLIQPQASAAAVKEAPKFTATITEFPGWTFPEDKRFGRSYWIPFSLATAASVADWTTTHSAIARGGREANVIFGGNDGRKVYYGANVAATAGLLGYTAWLEHKGHPKIARFLLYLVTGLRTTAAIWNHSRRR